MGVNSKDQRVGGRPSLLNNYSGTCSILALRAGTVPEYSKYTFEAYFSGCTVYTYVPTYSRYAYGTNGSVVEFVCEELMQPDKVGRV